MKIRVIQLVLLLSMILVGACGSGEPATMGTQVLSLKASLSEIKTLLDGIQIGANQIATDRIHQMRVEAEGLIGRLDKLQQDGFKNGNDILNDITRSTHQLSNNLRQTVKETEHSVFLDLNSSLANLNNTLDGLPLVDVDAYVAAVEPMRISKNLFDRRITLFGYFPALKKGRGEVRILVLGQTLRAQLSAGGMVSFDLPIGALQEETFVPFEIEIDPDGNFISKLWKRKQLLKERLYVELAKPFSCRVAGLGTNPEWEVEVHASREFTERARTEGGENRPSVNGSRTAQELFTATVDNAAALYDTSTVKIRNPRGRTWDGKPCDHASPSASFKWTPEEVSYSLSAPTVGAHFHDGNCWDENLLFTTVRRCDLPTLKGGGGSHADVAFNPVFVAHRLGVPQYVENVVGTFSLGRHQTLEQTAPFEENWKLRVICSFKDGSEAWDTKPIELSAMDPEETVEGVSARVSGSKLILATD